MKSSTSETGLRKLEDSRVTLHFIRAPVITRYTHVMKTYFKEQGTKRAIAYGHCYSCTVKCKVHDNNRVYFASFLAAEKGSTFIFYMFCVFIV